MKPADIQKYFHPHKLDKSNYNYFIPRTSVLGFINQTKHLFKGKVVDLACGNMPYAELIKAQGENIEYIPMDVSSEEIYANNDKVTLWDGLKIPLQDEEVDTIIITEFLEHIGNPLDVLAEIKRVLKKGGVVIGTVPFIWPMHETPHDHYRYTSFGLKGLLEKSGFDEIEMHSLGGRKKAFALSIALWLEHNSSVFSKLTRIFWISFMKRLIKNDKKEDVFLEGSLYTGLGFISRK